MSHKLWQLRVMESIQKLTCSTLLVMWTKIIYLLKLVQIVFCYQQLKTPHLTYFATSFFLLGCESLINKVNAMVNCMSQLEWAKDCPHGPQRTLFLGCIYVDASHWCQYSRLSSPRWMVASRLLKDCIKQKAVGWGIHPFSVLPPCLNWEVGFLLPWSWHLHHQPSWFLALGFSLRLHHWLSWICLKNGRSWDFSASTYDCMSQFLMIYLYQYWSW